MPEGDYVTTKEHVTLEEAEMFAKLGWEVWVDPWDLEALTRWEQIERSLKKSRSWRDWPRINE